ncbi:MAG: hypothetical protein A2845_05225 [Candidatus Lloydbacteria bacterium RIFCSPHIGHO2_01_FULL_49_22]|uniref:DNA polymerase III subunit delta n=1 Tax=Candidatus Lloydbacteria bacterium RIFCSPHIGHO2_01_FULL_49_22 TaxID=1798658 RepID=A0A1G2CTT9_9BACT|nr:MAG: hypothetical protein A2845_05225 [Candidatus Lloydbacteria bacterium RIFCSPHIGHO2_01_FULL_49_22]OGZ09174.1 MAG: hypothetical protein A3C14_04290 [Candidatus Lloydbacteria bacterium RIFCSPHIGHO2_02_FULL_50_18]
MDLRPHIALSSLSHAYVIEGARASGLSALRDLMESFGIAIKANPDYHEYQYETLLIEHARELRREQGMRGAEGAKKIFVVAFNAIHHESQNALLKTLEEPTDNTHFFFLVRTSEILLPTVRSRMQVVRGEESKGDALPLAAEFLKSSISARMKMIEPMTKAKTDDKPRAKEEARLFVEALEPLLYEKITQEEPRITRALEDVLIAKRELSGRSPSVKLLLEHLVLTVPRGS